MIMGIGTREDNKLRLCPKFSKEYLNTSDEVFKTVWNTKYAAFKNRTKYWCAESDGYISTKPIKNDDNLPSTCLFDVQFDEYHRFSLKNIHCDKFISFDSSNPRYLFLSTFPSLYYVAIKVSFSFISLSSFRSSFHSPPFPPFPSLFHCLLLFLSSFSLSIA